MLHSVLLASLEGSALLEGPGRGGECRLRAFEYGSPIWSVDEAYLLDHRIQEFSLHDQRYVLSAEA